MPTSRASCSLRGLWLVLLELTVIRVAWTFNFDFADYLLAGVIWVIGWCMVLMAGLVRLPVPAVGGLGLAIIALHNAVMPKLVPLLPEARPQHPVHRVRRSADRAADGPLPDHSVDRRHGRGLCLRTRS